MKPEPVYLKDGDVMELSIQGLGFNVRTCAPMAKPILLQIGNVTERMKNRFDALFDVHVWFDQQDQDAFVMHMARMLLASQQTDIGVCQTICWRACRT